MHIRRNPPVRAEEPRTQQCKCGATQTRKRSVPQPTRLLYASPHSSAAACQGYMRFTPLASYAWQEEGAKGENGAT